MTCFQNLQAQLIPQMEAWLIRELLKASLSGEDLERAC